MADLNVSIGADTGQLEAGLNKATVAVTKFDKAVKQIVPASNNAGFALQNLRKFEQKGLISLEALLKLQMVLGGLENVIKSIQPNQSEFSSIDEVLEANKKPTRKRGNRR